MNLFRYEKPRKILGYELWAALYWQGIHSNPSDNSKAEAFVVKITDIDGVEVFTHSELCENNTFVVPVGAPAYPKGLMFDLDAQARVKKVGKEWVKSQQAFKSVEPKGITMKLVNELVPIHPERKTLFVSFEQESIVNDVTTCPVPESARKGRLNYGYVTVSDTPWGHEGPDHSPYWIGPVHEKHAKETTRNVVGMLMALGNKVVHAGNNEKGEWRCGIYQPHTSEM